MKARKRCPECGNTERNRWRGAIVRISRAMKYQYGLQKEPSEVIDTLRDKLLIFDNLDIP